ncbi:MAG: hypothetical protein HY254_24500 [Burkholderiales bacterium]|nr:hypothetical protein [Burkholderiales bacterium]
MSNTSLPGDIQSASSTCPGIEANTVITVGDSKLLSSVARKERSAIPALLAVAKYGSH